MPVSITQNSNLTVLDSMLTSLQLSEACPFLVTLLGVNLIALPTRFAMTCLRRSESLMS